MNEKEAREIWKKHDAFGHFEDIDGHGRARGYLEALDKAKGLEEFVKNLDCECDSFQGYKCERCKTLAKYRSEK